MTSNINYNNKSINYNIWIEGKEKLSYLNFVQKDKEIVCVCEYVFMCDKLESLWRYRTSRGSNESYKPYLWVSVSVYAPSSVHFAPHSTRAIISKNDDCSVQYNEQLHYLTCPLALWWSQLSTAKNSHLLPATALAGQCCWL